MKVACSVVGKRTDQCGWIFKRQVYLISLEAPSLSPRYMDVVCSSFAQYCAVEVGDTIDVKMHRYTEHGKEKWTPYPEYAKVMREES